MAHIGEEVTLCFIGGTGGVQGILQNLSLLFFFVFLVIDTAGKKNSQPLFRIWIVYMNSLKQYPVVSLSESRMRHWAKTSVECETDA